MCKCLLSVECECKTKQPANLCQCYNPSRNRASCHQQNARDSEVTKGPVRWLIFHLLFPRIAFSPKHPAIYRSWIVLHRDNSSLCGLRKKLHGVKTLRQGIKAMTCSQALHLSQSTALGSWHRQRNQWIIAFPCSCDILSDA